MKTIVALSTPNFKSAIHIIRISGDRAFEAVQKISKHKIIKKGYTIQKVDLYDSNKKIDEVLLNKFICPKSYTGEDLIEINCHGSLYIVNKIISALIKNGCVLAQRGEFTKRAFLNNKISLMQSEAINNLVNATNDLGVNIALNGLSNKTNDVLLEIRNNIFKILGQIEVNIDYPEYESTPDVTVKQIKKIFIDSINTIKKIIDNSDKVIPIRDGIKTAILGRPNVGKSSLLNALLKEEKVIVSDVPGTTRDAIESSCVINGIKFNFIDTAGIRKTTNKIEQIGVNKAIKISEKADLILLVVDNSTPLKQEDKQLIKLLNNKNYIVVLNKSDIAKKLKIKGLEISAKNDDIKNLLRFLSSYKNINKIELEENLLLQSEQSIQQLKNVLMNIIEAQKIYLKNIELESASAPLQQSIETLDKLLGSTKEISFVDELFDKFCVGK